MKLIIYILFVILGNVTKCKIKNFKAYNTIILLAIAIMMLFSTDRPDYIMYEHVYNHIGTGVRYLDTGLGWWIICDLGNKIGLSYNLFSSLLFFLFGMIASCTINRIVKKKENTKAIWTLFLIFPAFMEAVQIRFFVAECIVIYGLGYFFRRNRKGYIIYFVTCIVASFVHISSIFYMIFLLSIIMDKIKSFLSWLVAIMSAFALFGKRFIYYIATLFVNQTRIERYFGGIDGVGPFGIAAYLFTLIMFWCITYGVLKESKKCILSEYEKNIVECIYQFSIIIWILFPLTTFDTNFFRIQRILWIIIYSDLLMLKEKGNSLIRIAGVPIPIRKLSISIAVFGFVFYMAAFNMDVIEAFLL